MNNEQTQSLSYATQLNLQPATSNLNQIYNTGSTPAVTQPTQTAQDIVLPPAQPTTTEPVYVAPAGEAPAATAPSGGTTANTSIAISEEALVANKAKLEQAAQDIVLKWEIINGFVNTIEDSWAGKDAEAYINKLNKMKPKLESVSNALKLIARTYEKALEEIKNTQESVQKDLL